MLIFLNDDLNRPPSITTQAKRVGIDPAQRFSDHAPRTIDYAFSL